MNELETVQRHKLLVRGAQGAPPPENPHRALRLVYVLEEHPDQILWPYFDQPDEHTVTGILMTEDMFSAHVDAEEAFSFPKPYYHARIGQRVVLAEAGIEFIDGSELSRRQQTALRHNLDRALDAARVGDRIAALAAITDAYLASPEPENLIPAVLRVGMLAGFAHDQASLRSSLDVATQDLVRILESEGTLDSVRSHLLWRRLPAIEMRETWLLRAKELANASIPKEDAVLAPMAPPYHAILAAYLARQARTGDLKVSSAQLRQITRGESAIIEQIADPALRAKIQDDPVSYRQVVAKTRLGRLSLVRARLAELSQHARTVHTLETTLGHRERVNAWRYFCEKTAQLGRYNTRFPWEEGKHLAEAFRMLLDLHGPIPNVHKLLESAGAAIFPIEVQTNGVDALTLLSPAAPPCTYVSWEPDALVRRPTVRRFVLLHELAHLIFDRHSAPTLDRVCTVTSGDDQEDPAEQRANSFAVYCLAPMSGVQQQLSGIDLWHEDRRIQATLRIAEHYMMSLEAAAWHIGNCHLGVAAPDQSFLNLLKVEAQHRSLNVDGRCTEPNLDQDGDSRLPMERRGRFLSLLRDGLGRGLLERSDAALVLGCTESDVDRLLN